MRRLAKRVLNHPRTAVALLMLAYGCIATAGAVGLLSPHTLNDSDFYRYPSSVGAVLALLGGVAGAASVPCGVWWLERGAVSLMVGGLAVRVYSLGYQYSHGATTWGEAAISVSFLACIVLGLLVRLIYIRGLALDPRI